MPTKKQIEHSWEKASTVRRKDPDTWRKDDKRNQIRRGSYGTERAYGWEVDHKNPISKGGTDSLRNLQALHWKANRQKGAKRK